MSSEEWVAPQAAEWKRSFGRRVRALRTERGLSQERLAHLAGVHRTYAGAVERGEQNISLTNIHEFALARRRSQRSVRDSRFLTVTAHC
jgi:transcriptional regulator with XRE-family HTH domain